MAIFWLKSCLVALVRLHFRNYDFAFRRSISTSRRPRMRGGGAANGEWPESTEYNAQIIVHIR